MREFEDEVGFELDDLEGRDEFVVANCWDLEE